MLLTAKGQVPAMTEVLIECTSSSAFPACIISDITVIFARMELLEQQSEYHGDGKKIECVAAVIVHSGLKQPLFPSCFFLTRRCYKTTKAVPAR
jgi:hypothetical protein